MRRDAVIHGTLVALGALATVSLGVAGAPVIWRALGHFPDQGAASVTASDTRVAEEADLSPVLALAPFGVAISAEAGPVAATLGDLTLRGVILARPAEQSSALIAEGGREMRPVAIGESLSGGAVLESVASDHAVLVVGGRRERLGFPEAAPSGSGVATIRASIPGLSATQTGAPAPAATPTETVDLYRQKIADNPQTVVDELGVTPGPDGYRVGQNLASNVRRAGLQPGDLVVRINGIAVGDIEQDRLNFETIAASGRARVEVMRDDRLLILSFPLR